MDASFSLFPVSVALIFYSLGAGPIESIVFSVPFAFSLIFIGKGGNYKDIEDDYVWENPFAEKKYILKVVGFSVVSLVVLLLSIFFIIGLWQLCILSFLISNIFHNLACYRNYVQIKAKC